MAPRKSAGKRSTRKKSGPSPVEALLRPGLIGSVLVLLSVFTLLSLVAGSRGALTAGWVAWLRTAFGAGVWAVPVVTGVAGLAIVFAAMDARGAPQWRRTTGVLLLFLALLIGLSLSEPVAVRRAVTLAGGAGGRVGTELANGLQAALTATGAWAVVAFLTLVGLIFLTDRLLVEAVAGLGAWLREQLSRRPQPPVFTGTLEPGSLPLFQAVPPPRRGPLAGLRALFGARRATAPASMGQQGGAAGSVGNLQNPWVQPGARPSARGLVQPTPVDAAAAALAASASNAAAAAATGSGVRAAASVPGPTAPRPAELLQPRMVGGQQEWRLPSLTEMLSDWERRTDSDELIREQGRLIQETLALFGVPADFEGAYKGPSVTQYLIKPGYTERILKGEQQRTKVKVARIAALSNDLALALAAPSVRIEAPIPGTSYVGIEVPNHESNVVGLKELMESETFAGMKGRLKIALGEDVKGQAVAADLSRMPHLLIAGATGSGKSVCINSIVTCLLLTHTPDTLRMLMVDPKMVELSVYNGVPHLLSPVVTEVDKAAGVLFWAVKEMERRYTLFSKAGARDLIRFNEGLARAGERPLPYIVVIVDEMADLMMAAPEEVEKHICRLAQMARATGIHLIIATQRPSVDVITGLIKANFPARIAFAVTSQVDSRVILDIPGAERLLGRGDMLFMAPDAGKLERLQGTWLSDEEIGKVVRFWKGVRVLDSRPAIWEHGERPADALPGAAAPAPSSSAAGATARAAAQAASSAAPLFEQIEALKVVDERDVLFEDAVRAVLEAGKGSVSLLQKRLRIGYSRASRLVEQLEAAGVLGPDQGGTLGRALTGHAARSPMPSAPLPSAQQPGPPHASMAAQRPAASGTPPASAAESSALSPAGSELPDDVSAAKAPPAGARPAAPQPRSKPHNQGPNVWM